jgi:hypothetical protein
VGAVRVVLVLVLVVAAAYLAHRGLLAMERRGWVYYRTKGTGSMGAAAFFSVDQVFHPNAAEAVVEREEQQVRGARGEAAGDRPGQSEAQQDEPPDPT